MKCGVCKMLKTNPQPISFVAKILGERYKAKNGTVILEAIDGEYSCKLCRENVRVTFLSGNAVKIEGV